MIHLYQLRRYLSKLTIYLILCLGGLTVFIPFYYMVITSVKKIADVTKVPISLALDHWPTFEPYNRLLSEMPYLHFMKNSLWISLCTTLGTLFFSTLAGYAFAKHHFPYRDKIFMLLLATMMIPGSVLLVPGFLLMRDLGFINTYWSLILPGISGAFSVFLARQFIKEIPNDIIDAARIDGCSEWGIYYKIILPLSKPLLATLGILTFLYSWNNFMGPLLYLMDIDKYTLPLGIALLQGRYTRVENVQMAGAALAIIPVLVIFFFFQRQIIKSLASSALKE